MSGPQFMHLQSYSRKANKGGQSVQQVLDEAARVPEFSKHLADPRPPSLVYGVAVDGVRRLHDEMVAAGGVEVTLKDGRTARRGIRKDRHTLMTAVVSHPLPTDLVNTSPDARAEYEDWRNHNLAWLKVQFGDRLISVIEHWDEKPPTSMPISCHWTIRPVLRASSTRLGRPRRRRWRSLVPPVMTTRLR